MLAVFLAAGLLMCPTRAETAAGNKAVVIRPAAIGHYRADGKDARDDEVLFGMTVTVVGEPDGDGRRLVETPYRYQTLVDKDDILPDAEGLWTPTHCVTAPFADVQAAPDLKAFPPVVTLPRGALLKATASGEEYHEVLLPDGRNGHVRSPLLRPVRNWDHADAEANRRRVVEDALSYAGVSYRWGGKTPEGIDCSGLASMAYLLNGLTIYRNSQPRPGFPVALLYVKTPADGRHTPESLARLKPGDLLYWDGHQGVYIGEGKYIHADATSHRANVNSLFAGDPDFLEKLAEPGKLLACGTVYPDEPGRLTVRALFAQPDENDPDAYYFYARADGYAPTEAVLYPEGEGEGRPALAVGNPGSMLYGSTDPEFRGAPRYRYPGPGRYRPAVRFVNRTGWLPDGGEIASQLFVMPDELTVE